MLIDNVFLSIDLSKCGEKKIKLEKAGDREYTVEENEYVKGNIILDGDSDLFLVRAEVETIAYPYDYLREFKTENSINICLDLPNDYQALAIHKYNPFWTEPVFLNSSQRAEDIQKILINSGNEYTVIMPVSKSVLSEISVEGTELRINISPLLGGTVRISDTVAAVSKSDNPYKAVRKCYTVLSKKEIIAAPLKDNKSYPAELEGLGWCTWNACYHDVTETKIEDKLKEFKEKNVPISWIIIDDGWAQTEGFKIKSFYEDREKFPSGLKAFIKRIKAEYGLKYVGIWHSFTAYWFGIKEGSELYEDQEENLITNNSGIIMPSGDVEKAYKFFDKWHSYLREQGIDFLKVDTQGAALEFYKHMPNALQSVKNLHTALERSVLKNFGGSMINCMGLGNIDMFSREFSTVIRNSDDFFPNKEDGFEAHISQNVYNAVFNDDLYYCDFDMWWTNHLNAKQSCVLRAMSGGPVYVSDGIGDTDAHYLTVLTDDEGRLNRCDRAAKPTADCLFGYEDVLKIYNKIGNDYVVGFFNLSNVRKTVTFKLSDIYENGKYETDIRFAQRKDTMYENDEVEIVIDPNDVEIMMLTRY